MRIRFKLPSPAMTVACIALAVALSGASYAAVNLPRNSVGAKHIKTNGVRASEIRANAVGASEIRANAVSSSEVADASLLAADVAAGQGLVSGIVVRRVDVALADGTNVDGAATCNAGERVVAGSANLSAGFSADAKINVSRPTAANKNAADIQGDAPDGWRATAINPAGGSGDMTLRIWVVCLSG